MVTGATGFIGSHVAEALSNRGDEVLALVRSTSRLDNLRKLNVKPVIGDLREPKSLELALYGCEALFHVAADYRLWSRDPCELYESNVEGTRSILLAAKRAGVRRVVYTSSVGALGIPTNGEPGTEDSPVGLGDMVGHYKRSKYLAEQVALELADTQSLDIVIVNPSTPVGERDIKPTPTGKIVVDFLNRKMPAFVDTGLNLVDVKDAAAGHVLAFEKGIPGRKYILGNRNVTLQEMLEILAGITGLKSPKVRIPYAIAYAVGWMDTAVFGTLLRREPHVPLEGVKMARKHMYFCSERAIAELGMPQSPIEVAMERAVSWFRMNGYVT